MPRACLTEWNCRCGFCSWYWQHMLRIGLVCFADCLCDKLIFHHYTTLVPLPFRSVGLLDTETHQPRRTRPRFPGSCFHYSAVLKLKFEFEEVARQPPDTAQGREEFQYSGVGRDLRGRYQVECANSGGGGD